MQNPPEPRKSLEKGDTGEVSCEKQIGLKDSRGTAALETSALSEGGIRSMSTVNSQTGGKSFGVSIDIGTSSIRVPFLTAWAAP